MNNINGYESMNNIKYESEVSVVRRVSSGNQRVPIYVDWRHIVDLVKCPHILVGGSTGSGKSYLMKSMLCDVLGSDRCKVLVVDPKSVDYRFLLKDMRPWEGRQEKEQDEEIKNLWSMRGLRLYIRDDIDSMEVSRMLASLCDEMDQRYNFLMNRGYVEWKDYEDEGKKVDSKDGKNVGVMKYNSIWSDKRLVLFVDELADLMYWDRSKTCDVLLGYERESIEVPSCYGDSKVEFISPPLGDRYGDGNGDGYGNMDADGYGDGEVNRMRKIEMRMDDREWRLLRGSIEKYLMRLSMLGRAAGIHLVLGTQRPSSEILSGQLRANIPTRICLRVSNPLERNIILGNRCKELGERVLYYGNEFTEIERDLG